jgi:hypothetical protein
MYFEKQGGAPPKKLKLEHQMMQQPLFWVYTQTRGIHHLIKICTLTFTVEIVKVWK